MNGTVCTFAPHAASTCTAINPSPSLLAVETPLWAYLSIIALWLVVSRSASWLKDHYEITGRRPVRRWYGSTARVILRGSENDAGAPRYAVLAWDTENCEVPWLKVHQLDRDSRFWDEDAEPFWAPVTQFVPHSLRRFRPHLWRGCLPAPFARETYQRGQS